MNTNVEVRIVRRLRELALLFLKLGAIGFGGPAVHIATMEEETVRRRKWLTHDEFLDLVGATNLIPGPNSTEMAMHVGYRRAGLLGLVVAGACFILPAVLVTVCFAWLYVQLGRFPQEQVAPLLGGIQAAMMAVIVGAFLGLGRKAFKTPLLIALGIATGLAAVLLPGREVRILLIATGLGTLFSLLWNRWKDRSANGGGNSNAMSLAPLPWAAGAAGATASGGSTAPGLLPLALFFLKVGAVLYGSGYVLIAYLRGGIVEDYGWLSDAQLVDAIAIGQFTPGPILSTATFIGFVVMCPTADGNLGQGLQGAAVASLAIFLPSFVFVALLGPLVPRLRKARWASAFLDCINAASMGLMIAISLVLCWTVLVDAGEGPHPFALRWQRAIIAVAAFSLRQRWKLSPAWLVILGALAGWLFSLVA